MIYSIIIGLLAGLIASKLQSGSSNGFIINLFLGIVGGCVGGWLFGLLGINTNSWIGDLICGVVGAVVVLEEKDIAGFLKKAYSTAYQHLCAQDFYIELNQPVAFLETVSIVFSVLCGAAIVYIVFPLFFKKGQTPGKKVFKIGLASYDGYSFNNLKLLLRFIPLFLTVGITLLPFFNGIIVLFIIYVVMFLVSFALAMASPKKCALHDFVARTIVVDYKTSIIFDNEIDEEEYIEKEDNLPRIVQEDGDGEEPELKYEK